jgi:2'-5' RNA ligase
MAETALLVPIPEAAALVDPHRLRLTRAGADGIPPHVTLLYPFTDSAALTAERVQQAAGIVGAVAAFDVSLASTRRFELDPPILYLAPDPAAPFAELTRALVAAFPEHQPYEGRYPELVPHLTVAIADASTLAGAEAEIRPALPIDARVEEAWLMQRDDDGRWRRRDRLALGG